MLHESDTDDWCLAKRLRPYEYLSQCQCSMSNTFFFYYKDETACKISDRRGDNLPYKYRI